MEKLTVIIPCKNEEMFIEKLLQSVSWADEIMVVDSFSTDKTLEIARKYTTKIFQREYKNSANQKNWAIPQASNPWILLIDGDEKVPKSLELEIKEILQNGSSHSAYWIGRENYFLDQKIKYSGWQNDAVIRLFKRDECKYEEKNVHAEIITEGTIGRLNNKLEHFTYKGLKDYLIKLDRYTTWGAKDRANKYKEIGYFHLLIKPLFRFIRHFFIKLGFLDGQAGFIISCLSSYTVFLRFLKLSRIKKGEKL